MPLLQDVRQWFRMRHPSVDRDAPELTNGPAPGRAGAALDLIEPKPTAPVEDEATRLWEAVEQQTERLAELAELLGAAPQALAAVPELRRQHQTLIEQIEQHVSGSAQRGQSLAAGVAELQSTNAAQQLAIEDLSGRLEAAQEHTTLTYDVLVDTREILKQVASAQHEAIEATRQIGQRIDRRDTMINDAVQRAHRVGVAIMIGCGAAALASVAALAASIVAALT